MLVVAAIHLFQMDVLSVLAAHRAVAQYARVRVRQAAPAPVLEVSEVICVLVVRSTDKVQAIIYVQHLPVQVQAQHRTVRLVQEYLRFKRLSQSFLWSLLLFFPFFLLDFRVSFFLHST